VPGINGAKLGNSSLQRGVLLINIFATGSSHFCRIGHVATVGWITARVIAKDISATQSLKTL
jgi:hypothetical protein